jgi:ankyrin repeat protein
MLSLLRVFAGLRNELVGGWLSPFQLPFSLQNFYNIIYLAHNPYNTPAIMKKCFSLLLGFSLLFQALNAQDLFKAIEARDYKTVESLLKSGAKINATNKIGQFPLWNAVWNEDTIMVKLLIANGADVSQKYTNKEVVFSCFEIACQNGLTDIARMLVENGANANEKGFRGHSPLRTAARNGRVDIVKYLVSKGAAIDAKGDDDQATPLESAAGKGHLEIVQVLVENGANVNHQDKDGDTPLGEAASGGFLEVVQYLLSKGADTSLKNKEGKSAEDIAKLEGQAKVEALLKEHRK